MNVVPLSRHAKPTWEEALEDFLNLKGAEGRAPRTLTDYRKHVTRFFKLYPDAHENERKALSSLLKHLAEAKTPPTHNLRLEYPRGYFRWLWEEKIVNVQGDSISVLSPLLKKIICELKLGS
jgi:hypothetical protein